MKHLPLSLFLLIFLPVSGWSQNRKITYLANHFNIFNYQIFTAENRPAQNMSGYLLQEKYVFILELFNFFQFVNYTDGYRYLPSVLENKLNSIYQTTVGKIWIETLHRLNYHQRKETDQNRNYFL